MDGTKLRTVLAVATSLNTALIATDITGFNNPELDTAYKIISIILNFIIVALVTYFNNDYTDEGMIGTNVTRQLKEHSNATVEISFGEEDDDDLEDAEEDDADFDEVIEEGESNDVE